MKKTVTKISLLGLILAMVTLIIAITPKNAYAYNTDTSEGVVVVAIYAKNSGFYYVSGGKYVKIKDRADGPISSGTGWFVGKEGEAPQYLVTNHHVVDDYLNTNNGKEKYILKTNQKYSGKEVYLIAETLEVRVYYSSTDSEVAQVVDYGNREKVDLAILKLSEPTNKRHALKVAVASDENIGDTVYAVGFPGVSENSMSSGSKWSSKDATVTKGAINRFVSTSGTNVKRIQMDAVIAHGNSGGPLVTEEGVVIGVNTNGYTNANDEKAYYAVDCSHVLEFLDKNKIEYERGQASGDDKKPEETKEDTKTSRDDKDDEESSLMKIVYIIIGAVVVAGVGTTVVLATRKVKTTPKAPATPGMVQPSGMQPSMVQPNTAQPVVRKTPMVRSLAAQHNGACFAIKNVLVVGRDKSVCTIVYQEGTVGVSGKHCTIEWKPETNEFVVTDLGSTYGTFLVNGRRLEANVPCRIKAGDSFYVGDKTNVIRVEVN